PRGCWRRYLRVRPLKRRLCRLQRQPDHQLKHQQHKQCSFWAQNFCQMAFHAEELTPKVPKDDTARSCAGVAVGRCRRRLRRQRIAAAPSPQLRLASPARASTTCAMALAAAATGRESARRLPGPTVTAATVTLRVRSPPGAAIAAVCGMIRVLSRPALDVAIAALPRMFRVRVTACTVLMRPAFAVATTTVRRVPLPCMRGTPAITTTIAVAP